MSLYTTAGAPRPIVRPTTERQKLIDGIKLIAPDDRGGMFFDAILETAGRIDKDTAPNFPVIVMVGSDSAGNNGSARDYGRLQDTIQKRGVTLHVVLA